ncbi:MAG: pyridoxal phosphate-dependent aminotransferase [Candidatus Zixiibacteriota bacterium]
MVKRLVLEKADRLYHLPSVIDEFLPGRRRLKSVTRHDLIDLARFNWQGAEPRPPVDSQNCDVVKLCQATATWYTNRFGGRLNPKKEIFIGGSIRQIINLLALVYFNPGDVVLIPDPGIWHYRAAAALASAETVPYHLFERNNYKPAIQALADNKSRLAKAMFLNSPQNPTGQKFTPDDLGELLHLAGRENLMLILDQAFEGLVDGDNRASAFALPGGRKVCVELYSYGYNFGQSSPAPAFAVGQPAIISALNQAAYVFGLLPTSEHITRALTACEHQNDIELLKPRFAERRKLAEQLCAKLRLIPAPHNIGPFFWAKLPGRKQSQRFCRRLYLRCGILAVPGIAFGENGEGYIRMSLTASTDDYKKAIAAADKLILSTQRKKSHG